MVWFCDLLFFPDFFSHTGLFPLTLVFLFVCFLYFKTFLEGFSFSFFSFFSCVVNLLL